MAYIRRQVAKFRVIAILFSLLFASHANADFNSALTAYESGDYKSAYQEFLSMAKLGEKRSQFNLGVMYFYGQHVAKNENVAYAWMKLSVEGETDREQENAALKSISDGLEDPEKAALTYQELAINYSTQALLDSVYPHFVKPENKHAFNARPTKIVEPRYPRKAAARSEQGWVRLEFDLDTKGRTRNIRLIETFPRKVFVSEAIKAVSKWQFEIALDKYGNAQKRDSVRYTLEFKMGGEKPLGLRKSYYEKLVSGAKQGDSVAQYKLGIVQKKYARLIPDSVNPNRWLLAAAKQNIPAAQYEIGRSLIHGQGCVSDKAKGIEWLAMAASSGEQQARQLLGGVWANESSLEAQQRAVEYLSGIESLQPAARLSFARLLVSSEFPQIANPQKAIMLVEDLEDHGVFDKATELEIRAAAFARMDNFEKALATQKEALEIAESRQLDLSLINANMQRFEKKQYASLSI